MRTFRFITDAVLGIAVLAAQAGCICPPAKRATARVDPCGQTTTKVANQDLPPNPVAGECYAKVFIPPRTETRTERVCVREASERLEAIPARYEWVEERVLVRDAANEIEVLPAEYEVDEETIEVEPAHVRWHVQEGDDCDTQSGKALPSENDVICLVKAPPTYRSIKKEVIKNPPTVRQTTIPAEYETVRVQRMVSPATVKRIAIPAEYETVEKTIVCGRGYFEWREVVCEKNASAAKVNEIKDALSARGYNAGDRNGRLDPTTTRAVKQFQAQNGLSSDGLLTMATLDKLGVMAP